MVRNKEFLFQKNEIEIEKFLEQYNFQEQNYKQNKPQNHYAGVLFHHLDHYSYDGIVFLKAVLRYAHNYVWTETIWKIIL
ncbi:hypothetical protein FLCH110379_11185 [Flavobacterium chungbukense]|uniref:Uncharacterized protein n=1 Tax=Flavobacterium chungbukense TaxID=877464 RepID=A0ABP7XW86_9FLAO